MDCLIVVLEFTRATGSFAIIRANAGTRLVRETHPRRTPIYKCLPMTDAKVLDTALAAGLDLPYACKGGVCCTCRAKVLEGEVEMEKNYTLEPWEMEKGFVLTCQARALTPRVVVSYDER